MKLFKNILLKHENCIDVAFYFVKPVYNVEHKKENEIGFEGYWINVGLVNPKMIDGPTIILIKKDDLFKWKEHKLRATFDIKSLL